MFVFRIDFTACKSDRDAAILRNALLGDVQSRHDLDARHQQRCQLATRLQHFAPSQVHDPVVHEMIGRIRVIADQKLDVRGHAAVDLSLTTTDGYTHFRKLDIPPGFPGAELDDAQHLSRFKDCLAYAPHPPSAGQVDAYLRALDAITSLPDVRILLPMLVVC